MQHHPSNYTFMKTTADQEQICFGQSNKKSKLDAISSFFKKWSNKSSSPHCDKRVDFGFDPCTSDNGEVWQDKYQFFVQPQTKVVNMHEFNFTAMTLEKAIRIFYTTVDLNMKESLFYDFSRRYFECNPRCIFGTTRVVHLIVCATVLLNSQNEINQATFVQNTMNVIYRHIGTSIQKTKTHRLNAEHLNWLFYNGSIHDAAFMPHDLSALIFGSIAWQSEIKTILKNIYTGIQSKPLEELSSRRMSCVTSAASMYRTFPGTPSDASSVSSSSDDSSDDESIISKSNLVTGIDLPSRYLKNAPYYKDGLLSCKCVLLDNNIVKQSWKTFFVMMERDELHLFPTHITESTTSNKETISLKHSISNILPFGYNQKRPHCFSIKLANGSAYIFEAKTIQDTKQWIATCNYWAARTTDSETLLDEKTQLKMLQSHINSLFDALDKKKRSTSLLREMMKYQTYCNSIESSLALQIKTMSFVN